MSKINCVADCLDATYDPEIESLILFCYLKEPINAKRVISFERGDFNYHGIKPVPEEEMVKTAKMWKGKPFYFQMDDDPNRDIGDGLGPEGGMDDDEYFMHEKVYMSDVGGTMMNVAETMNSDEWILKYKKDRLIKKEEEIKRKLRGL